MADSTLKIILKAIVKGDKDVKKLRDGIKGTGEAAEESAKKFGAFGRVLEAVTAGAIIGMAQQAGRMFLEFAEGGYAIRRAEQALAAYTGSTWDAEAATKAVMEASDGLLSRFEATQNAARLFSMGLAKNAEEAAHLTKIAIELGTAMGRGPQQAFEDFTLLLSNQSIQRLDTFGLSAAAVRQRIRELQAQTKGLDRQTAFLQATMELADKKLAQLAKQGYTAGTSMDRFSAQVRTATEDLKKWAAQVLDAATMTITAESRMREAVERHAEQMVVAADNYEDYLDELARAQALINPSVRSWYELHKAELLSGKASEQMYRAINALNPEMYEAMHIAPKLTDSFQRMTAAQANAAMESQELRDAFAKTRSEAQNLTLSFGKLNDGMIARNAIATLTQQLHDGKISMSQYKDTVFRLMVGYMGMSREEAEARVKMAELEAKMKDGTILASEYAAEAEKIVSALHNIPKEVEATIRINTIGAIPDLRHLTGRGGSYITARQYGGAVLPGLPYTVGERGQETFVPRERGNVVPAGQAAQPAAPINVTVYPRAEVDIVSALEEARWMGVLG